MKWRIHTRKDLFSLLSSFLESSDNVARMKAHLEERLSLSQQLTSQDDHEVCGIPSLKTV